MAARADLEAMLDLAGEGCLLLRRRGPMRPSPEIVYASRRLTELTGHPPEGIAGRSLRVLRAVRGPHDRFVELLGAIAEGRPFVGRMPLRTSVEGDRSFEVRLQPLAESRELLALLVTPSPDPAGPEGVLERLVDGAGRLADIVTEALYVLRVEDDLRLTLAWADPGIEELTGYTRAELAALGGPAALVVADDRHELRLRNQILLGGGNGLTTYRLHTRSGRIRRIQDRARPIIPAGDRLIRAVVGALADADEQPRSAGLRPAHERMAGFLGAQLQQLVCLVDERGAVTWASPAPETPLADAVRGLVATDVALLLPPALVDDWLDLVDRALAGREAMTGRFAWPLGDGTMAVQVQMAAVGQGCAVALFHSEDVAAQGEIGPAPPLLGSGERTPPHGAAQPDAVLLETILGSLPDAVFIVDAAGTVEWAGGSAERMLGRRGETLAGHSIETLFERPGADARHLLDSLVGEWPAGDASRELRARRRSGELFPVEVTGRAFGQGRRRFALIVRDLTLRAHTEEALASLAYHDTLTGLPNRLLFHDRLTQAVERGRRTRQMFAVMLVGLDRFKIINDSLGLEKGDHVLKAVAERLALAVRKSDTVARLGGDEFLLLLAGVESAEAVAKVAQKLLIALRPPLPVDGHELTAAASIGVALFPHDGDTPEALIKNADTALSRAKEQGRNHFQFYTTDMNATAIERLTLESRLRRALVNGEFVVHYQPQASLETGAIVGVEALIRWIDPVLGLVPPGDFIPLAEETGLIVDIGAWVLRAAAAEIVRWQRHLGRPELRLAVNLSARQFQQADLVDLIRQTLAATGLPASSLELEITESVLMREALASVRRLKDLTGLGVHLAIDDFGTGYSSLSYLRTFPIRSLKIDRTFIRDIDRDPSSATLAQGMVGLGRSLGLKVIAEGVETVRQLELLKGYGCQEMQGFLLCRPLPAEEALAVIEQGRTLEEVSG